MAEGGSSLHGGSGVSFSPCFLCCVAAREQRWVILLSLGALDQATLLEVAYLVCCIIDPACQSRFFILLKCGPALKGKHSFKISGAESSKTGGFRHQG